MRLKLPICILSLHPLGRAGLPRRFAKLACWGAAALLPLCAIAQLPQTPTALEDTGKSGDYVITERGPNHRVWQRITSVTNELGEVSLETNGGYTELATGMHHLIGGHWVESSDEIQITPDGGAATNCQHQVAFAANINTTGAIDLTMPDGQHLRSHILGLSYLDPTTGQYVLIARLKDSIGQVVGGNQVVYSDAFDGGFKADVRYRNTKAGFEQDIVLQEQPPSPAAFGLDPANTRLQVMTEFLNPPAAQVRRAKLTDGITVDKDVDFGPMHIIQGKAFSIGCVAVNPANRILVNKHWLQLNNRRVLVEDVPFQAVTPQLLDLPAPANGSSTNRQANADGLLGRVFAQLRLPPAPENGKPSNVAMSFASLPPAEKGFVLDYNTVVNGTSNLTFQSDTTYLISSNVYLNGTTTIEGGTVIKYDPTLSALFIEGSWACKTGPYRVAIFTSANDNSVGGAISGSTGIPQVQTNSMYLESDATNSIGPNDWSYLRFNCAGYGFFANNPGHSLRHCQFVNCTFPISYNSAVTSNSLTLRNILISACDTAITAYYVGSVDAENLTVDRCGTFLYDANSLSAYVTNSIFTSVTNVAGTVQLVNSHWETNGSVLYQTAGAGNYYLATNTYRNYGTTNINAVLLADLRQKTTFPPLIYSNLTVSSNTTLNPQAWRDTNSNPDLGYHYDPIDYLVDAYGVTNATLTVTNGTAVACYNESTGIWMQGGGGIVSVGSPLAPNWFTRYSSVQEQAIAIGTNGPSALCVNCYHAGAAAPNGTFRFSKFTCSAGGGYHIYHFGNFAYSNLLVQDCEMWSGQNRLDGGSPSTGTINNNLFRRSYITGSTSVTNCALSLSNNLVWQTAIFFHAPSSGLWSAYNNSFDSCTGLGLSFTNNGHNAYFNTSFRLSPTNGTEVISTNTMAYQSGPLGDYYQPTNSPLTNAGSTTANLVGLYDYTTQTNQVKETNSTVDIGYHYVATDTNGLPADTFWLGIPDYVADPAGNGALATWLIQNFGHLGVDPNDDPDGDGFTNLQEYQAGTNPRDHLVVAWGDNSSGQCNVPVGLTNVAMVVGGDAHSMALLSNGVIVAWGSNSSGQTNVPAGLSNVVSIAAGIQFSMALKNDGRVVAWGDTNYNETNVPASLTNAIAIAAGGFHGLALRADKTVTAWGYDPYGETDVPALGPALGIAAGWNHSVALLTNGTVRAWGYSGTNENWNITIVPPDLSNVVAIAAGGLHTLALKADGTVVAWGAGNGGDIDTNFNYGQSIVPTGLSNVVAIAAGENNSMALRADGSVVTWGQLTYVPQGLNGVVAIAAGDLHYLAVSAGRLVPIITVSPQSQTLSPGVNVTFSALGVGLGSIHYQWQFQGFDMPGATNSTLTITNINTGQGGLYRVIVTNTAGSTTSIPATLTLSSAVPGELVAWGSDTDHQSEVPRNLGTIVGAAGGARHSIALKENGTLVGWGANDYGQTNVSSSTTNVLAIACGADHNLALKAGGSVVAWGNNSSGQTNVPGDVTNAISVSAGGNQSLALLNNGTVRQWGQTNASVPASVSNVIDIASGTNFHLALLSNSTVVAWGNNSSGQTNVPAGLSNIVSIAAGGSHALALRQNGTVIGWGDNSSGQTNVPAGLTNVMAIAAGVAHNLALKNDGTVLAWGGNSLGQTNLPFVSALTGVKFIAAGANHNLAGVFSPFSMYPVVDVTKDLLLIYNTNSVDSSNVCSYYLAHRPMVANANVLGIGCPGFFVTNAPPSDSHVGVTNTTVYESISPADFTNQISNPLLNWLAANPTKRPSYVILFLDVPSRIANCATNPANFPFYCGGTNQGSPTPSVSVQLTITAAGWSPFVTHINMNGTNDCIGYINKLASIGTNYSPGRLMISANAGGYGNTNYYIDTTGGTNDCGLACHITSGSNVAGYYSNGAHSSLGADYATNGYVNWTGNSSWWLILTGESFNGQRFEKDMGRFVQWFSPTAFGGTNYSNTPVGAVSYVGEPGGNTTDANTYFGYWTAGKNFAITAWESERTIFFQAVGDPFVTK